MSVVAARRPRVSGKPRPVATPQLSHTHPATSHIVATCAPPPDQCAAADHDYGTVCSLKDLIKWPVAYAHLADGDPADVAQAIGKSVTSLHTFSSSFSGVCAEKVAFNCMGAGLEHLYGCEFPKLGYLSAIDHNVECQHECKLVPGSAGCVFTSMETFCSDSLKRELANESEPYDTDRLFDLCMRPGALRLDGWCCVHNKRCVHPRASAHSGSIPCTDWSNWGRCKRLTGPTAIPTMIFLALRLVLMEGLVMIENVVPFDWQFVARYVGNIFEVLTSTGCNTNFGSPSRRPRRFTLLLLRGLYGLGRTLQDFTEVFARKRHADLTWRCFLCATDSELRAELHWASSRSGIVDKPHVHSGCPEGKHFRQALLASEEGRLQGFLNDHNCHDCVVSLGQDPQFTRAASQSTVLHCLVRNNHIQYIPELDRWFSMRELFLWQMFPVSNQALAWCWEDCGRFHNGCPPPLTSLNKSRLQACLPPRSRTEAGHQAGNSICVSTVGAFLMFVLLHLERRDVSIPASPASLAVAKRAGICGDGGEDAEDADPMYLFLAARKKRRTSGAGVPSIPDAPLRRVSGVPAIPYQVAVPGQPTPSRFPSVRVLSPGVYSASCCLEGSESVASFPTSETEMSDIASGMGSSCGNASLSSSSCSISVALCPSSDASLLSNIGAYTHARRVRMKS